MAFKNGRLFMPFGTPGGDVQQQAMLQVFINVIVHGMPLQRAIEAPAAGHALLPGFLLAASRTRRACSRSSAACPPRPAQALAALGHKVSDWPEWDWRAGAVCAVAIGPDGTRHGRGRSAPRGARDRLVALPAGRAPRSGALDPLARSHAASGGRLLPRDLPRRGGDRLRASARALRRRPCLRHRDLLPPRRPADLPPAPHPLGRDLALLTRAGRSRWTRSRPPATLTRAVLGPDVEAGQVFQARGAGRPLVRRRARARRTPTRSWAARWRPASTSPISSWRTATRCSPGFPSTAPSSSA